MLFCIDLCVINIAVCMLICIRTGSLVCWYPSSWIHCAFSLRYFRPIAAISLILYSKRLLPIFLAFPESCAVHKWLLLALCLSPFTSCKIMFLLSFSKAGLLPRYCFLLPITFACFRHATIPCLRGWCLLTVRGSGSQPFWSSDPIKKYIAQQNIETVVHDPTSTPPRPILGPRDTGFEALV